MPQPEKITYFRTAAAFRLWLRRRFQMDSELWVGFYKKACGKASISYSEAVDEALCFGWIDGVRKSVSAEAYTIRFTQRKPKSQWSAVNIKRVERLTSDGRMHSAGLQAFQGATKQKRKYSFEQRHESRLTAADERLFRGNRKAWEYFQAQPPWYRRTAIFWVVSAKKEETRQRRLAILITDSAANRSIRPLTRPSQNGRKSVRESRK